MGALSTELYSTHGHKGTTLIFMNILILTAMVLIGAFALWAIADSMRSLWSEVEGDFDE